MGRPTQNVKDFIVEAFMRAAMSKAMPNTAKEVPVDGTTAVFTKWRYRNAWNRTVVRRIAKERKHTIKIKGVCKPRSAAGRQCFTDQQFERIRRRVRPQCLFNMNLAGDGHADAEDTPISGVQHLMRVMLVANLAVDQRFANGTQMRVLYWHPRRTDRRNKPLRATDPELLVRCAKEAALKLSLIHI